MSRNFRIPSLRRHRTWGLAVVTLNGKDHYLGKWPENLRLPPAAVQEAYDRLIAEWLASNRRLPRQDVQPAAAGPTINELILAYIDHCRVYYRHADGRPTTEQGNIRQLLKRLRRLYGSTLASDFDSLALEAFREAMIGEGLARTRINRDIVRLKGMFGWASAKRMIPATTPQMLRTVKGLEAGRSSARESEPVTPVPEDHVEAVLPRLSRVVRTMVRLQRLTGMRPGEVVLLRTADIDRGGPLWLYRPQQHKSAWRGKERVIALGPQAQALLRPWLRANLVEYLFQPREAVREKLKRLPAVDRGRAPGMRYRVSAYGHAVRTACRKAAVPVWSPGRLRHNFATEVRRRYGLEAAGAVLGHAELETSQIYAQVNLELAERVAREIG